MWYAVYGELSKVINLINNTLMN